VKAKSPEGKPKNKIFWNSLYIDCRGGCDKQMAMKTVTVKAPAKVNTVLKVVGVRDNGFHDLEMIMVPLTLSDEITLTAIPEGIELRLDGQGDDGMLGDDNLACRAAREMFAEAGVSSGVKIELKKRIPVAAGLGGGSSDAAAVLRGMNALLGLDWPSDRLAKIGERLGSDVPFFCYDGPALVTGIGDRVKPLDKFPNTSFILVNPGFAVSTPWVYKKWDEIVQPREIKGLTVEKTGDRVPPASPVEQGRPFFQVVSEVVDSLHNDLEVVTIPEYPEIGKIKNTLMSLGAAGTLMSGSGPTVFGIFENKQARDEALSELGDHEWRVFAAESVCS
jgi:4-diphosphocytidyl-2-C-methyl-D-erythritol kinase